MCMIKTNLRVLTTSLLSNVKALGDMDPTNKTVHVIFDDWVTHAAETSNGRLVGISFPTPGFDTI